MEFISDRCPGAKSKKTYTPPHPADGPREASHDTSLHITRENGSKVIGETEGKCRRRTCPREELQREISTFTQ
jgi:hypothetical protein